MDDQVPSPGGDLPEALRARLEQEDDVVLAYLFGRPRAGAAGHPPELGLGILLQGEGRDRARELELHTLVGEVAGPVRTDLVVLNGASAATCYRVLTEGSLLLSRDERVRARHAGRTIERYFDVPALRQMLAAGLRHRLDEGGPPSGR